MLVLELLAKKSMYGYEMIQTLKGTSEDFFALKEGTLYPILYRLEDNDFAKSSHIAAGIPVYFISYPSFF